MRTWTATATAEAHPEAVLHVLTDPDAASRWAPVPFDVEDDRRLAAGSRARVSGRLAGRRVGFDVEVHSADANGLALTATGPVAFDVDYRLAPTTAGVRGPRIDLRAAATRPHRPPPRRGHGRAAQRGRAQPRPLAPDARSRSLRLTPQGLHDRSRLRAVRPPQHRPRRRLRDRPDPHLRRGRLGRPRAARRLDRGARGPVRGRDGPVGLRQVDADAPARRARHAGRRRRPHRRRGHHPDVRPRADAPAPQAHRLRLPVLQPAADALGRGERPAAAGDRRPQAGARTSSTRCWSGWASPSAATTSRPSSRAASSSASPSRAP